MNKPNLPGQDHLLKAVSRLNRELVNGASSVGYAYIEDLLSTILEIHLSSSLINRWGIGVDSSAFVKEGRTVLRAGSFVGQLNADLKLKLARELGLLDDETFADTRLLKAIRNRFAHDLDIEELDELPDQLVSDLRKADTSIFRHHQPELDLQAQLENLFMKTYTRLEIILNTEYALIPARDPDWLGRRAYMNLSVLEAANLGRTSLTDQEAPSLEPILGVLDEFRVGAVRGRGIRSAAELLLAIGSVWFQDFLALMEKAGHEIEECLTDWARNLTDE